MTDLEKTLHAWKSWDAAAWSEALLNHYFRTRPGEAGPISRLVIGPEELAIAAGAPPDEGHAAREAFLTAIRCSPSRFKTILSRASLRSNSWNPQVPPPFIAHLLFTCYAAASLDAETFDLGDFRERLRQLLQHNQHTTYPLEDLPLLWEAFAGWLQQRRDEGHAYRALLLPDPGWMTRIGYSLRLAFPSRTDRLRLRDVLAGVAIDDRLTVQEVFRAISKRLDRFTVGFREVFDRARKAFVRAEETPELHALWSAALEASTFANRSVQNRGRVRYQLFLQEDELGQPDPFLVATTMPRLKHAAGLFMALEEPIGDFRYLVSGANGNTTVIAQLLLSDALDNRLPDFSDSSVSRTTRQGVLLFRRNDNSSWELTSTKPVEGRVRVLLLESLCEDFLKLLDGHYVVRTTRFDAWRDIGPFDISNLSDPRANEMPKLVAVRCLQTTEIGTQLHLVGGVRIDGAYLGTSSLLPNVKCPGADNTVAFRLHDEFGQKRSELMSTLVAKDPQTGVFGWAPDQPELEGSFLFAGFRNGAVIASRETSFVTRGLSHTYCEPTNPSQWAVEGSTTDVRSIDDVTDHFLQAHQPFPSPQPKSLNAADSTDLPVLNASSIDDNRSHDQFVEAIAAIAVRRKGIAEAELIEVLEATMPDSSEASMWAVIRAWVEAGYFDVLTRLNWRGRFYFACEPRLVLPPRTDDGEQHIVLYGLSPLRLRSAAREAFAATGAEPLPARSLSKSVSAPLSWRIEAIEQAETVTKKLGLKDLIWVRDPKALAGNIEQIVSDRRPLPPGYEYRASWDWNTARFSKVRNRAEEGELRVEQRTRIDRPDRYIVTDGRDDTRATLSRSWALLHAYARRGLPAFERAGKRSIIRKGGDGPFIPLPIARAIGLTSGIAAGPLEDKKYGYATRDKLEQRWLVGWLRGYTATITDTTRFSWLLAAADSFSPAVINIPPDVRRQLLNLSDIPEAQSLANRRIPRYMLPHLRHALGISKV